MRKKADVCIIGGGLTGLAVAAQLERAGVDYVVIEAQAEAGGLLRGQEQGSVWLDYGLKSIPAGEELSENPLLKFKKAMGLDVPVESWTDGPKTWSNGVFCDFMGFGEAKNRALVEELSYYTETPRLMVAGGWRVLVEKLLQSIPENRLYLKTHVTKFNVEDDEVKSVILNADFEFKAQKYVFTLSPMALRHLLPQNAVSGKTLQRIARAAPLTAVCLDIATEKKFSDAKNIFVFQDAAKEKNEDPFFVIGQFVTNADPARAAGGLQVSTWMTFVDPESLEDDENASKIIKQMKRLIKKAFPDVVDQKKWERLLVIPSALGKFEQLSLESNLTLPGIDNLWICSGRNPGEARNIGAALECALAAGRTVATETETVTETPPDAPNLSSTP